MASKKKPSKIIKLQLMAGKATPAPPVGTALGPTGINMPNFCKEYNDKTREQEGMVVPVVVNVYEDRTYDFVLKKPPTSVLIKKSLNLEKGSSEPNKNKIATLTKSQLEEIAKNKMSDLNAFDLEQAKKIVAGTARSMGVLVE